MSLDAWFGSMKKHEEGKIGWAEEPFWGLGNDEGEIVVSQRSFFRFRVLGHEKGEIVVSERA
jgi:hypothetical protein